MKLQVIQGDISRVSTDALITAINSGGMWFGGIDGVINRAAGNFFHQQAGDAMPLSHGQVVVARGNDSNQGAFKNVVFVVDDLRGPLSQIVYAGLKGASEAGFSSATLPTIRMGVMLGAVEKSPQEAILQMAAGVKKFMTERPNGLNDITFVIYNDAATQRLLEAEIASLNPIN